MNYSAIKFHYGIGASGYFGPVANASQEHALNSRTATSLFSRAVGTSIDNGSVNWSGLLISDSEGNGTFEYGDSITFDFEAVEPFSENTVYTLAFAYVENHYTLFWEYSCAMSNGKFYSWQTSNLDTNQPWWEH